MSFFLSYPFLPPKRRKPYSFTILLWLLDSYSNRALSNVFFR
nr:MAG TPA: hypothetical protein [Caudoviricetes sp.]